MNRSRSITCYDTIFLVLGVFVFFGCIASSYRSAKTLQPSQVSVGAGYLQAIDVEGRDVPSMKFASLDARAGIARGMDIGIMHSWDLTEGNEGALSTIWGDAKVQVSNRDNKVREVIASLGLIKGYVYDDEDDGPVHVTGLPFMLGLPVTTATTLMLNYQLDMIGETFIPEGLDNMRHTITVGGEFNIVEQRPGRWTPKLGVGIGYLFGGAWANKVNLNLGISIDSPQ